MDPKALQKSNHKLEQTGNRIVLSQLQMCN